MVQSTRERSLYPIILNSSNLVSGNSFNNKFRYVFPLGSVKFENSQIAVSNISIYYSWFNITSENNNNTFEINHPGSGADTNLVITLPDGFYSITAINSYIQQELITAGLYLIDPTGATTQNVYYAEIIENSVYYGFELKTYELPLALPAGWTNGGSFTFPLIAKRPQLVIPDNFSQIVGFTAGSYPTSTTGGDYEVLSNITPQITPIQSLIVSCNLLNNTYSNPTTVLYSFSPNVAYGSLIVAQPVELSFIDIKDGSYYEFEITLLDQNFQDVSINDTNLIIQFLISNYKENF